ncbi:hypothetical protein Hanom_Chr02g00103471 [Helianthus anomalus]
METKLTCLVQVGQKIQMLHKMICLHGGLTWVLRVTFARISNGLRNLNQLKMDLY